MSGSNWHDFAKDRLGLIVALFVAAIVGIITVEVAWLEQRDLYDQAARNAAYYAENAKNNIAVNCGVEAPANCAQQINDAARKEQREEYDLYSQRAVALWTAVMGGMAVLGVALSAVGVYLIWTTFRETRSTAKAALDANLISDRIAQAELRPYLFVDRLELAGITDNKAVDDKGNPIDEPGWFSAQVVIYLKNVGKVPARNITVYLKQYMGWPYDGRFRGLKFLSVDTWLCAPGHERRVFGRIQVPQQDRRDFDRGVLCYIIRLRFTFEDERGNLFTEKAAFSLSGDDLKTFYLFRDPRIAEHRKASRQRELDFQQQQKRKHSARKPRKKKGAQAPTPN